MSVSSLEIPSHSQEWLGIWRRWTGRQDSSSSPSSIGSLGMGMAMGMLNLLEGMTIYIAVFYLYEYFKKWIQDILLLEEDLDHHHRNISTRQVDSFLSQRLGHCLWYSRAAVSSSSLTGHLSTLMISWRPELESINYSQGEWMVFLTMQSICSIQGAIEFYNQNY